MCAKEAVMHTPGPWQWRYDGDSIGRIVVPYDRGYRGDLPDTCVLAKIESTSPDRAQADGRLIAAAPRMRQTLNAIVEMKCKDSAQGVALIQAMAKRVLQEVSHG